MLIESIDCAKLERNARFVHKPFVPKDLLDCVALRPCAHTLELATPVTAAARTFCSTSITPGFAQIAAARGLCPYSTTAQTKAAAPRPRPSIANAGGLCRFVQAPRAASNMPHRRRQTRVQWDD